MGRSMAWLQVTAAPCPPVPSCVTTAWSKVTVQGLLGGHELSFRGETRWGHPHSLYAGFLVQCPAPPRATVTFGIEWQHKLSDLPRAHVSHVRAGGVSSRRLSLCWSRLSPLLALGSTPSQPGCGRGRGELWAPPPKDKMGTEQGCSEAALCVWGVGAWCVPSPPAPGTARRSRSSSQTENKSASCSRPVFKAGKVGAVRAVPGWAALPASTCGDQSVPRLPATGAGLGRAGGLPERPCLENLAPTFILSLLFPALCWREGRRDNAASAGATPCSPCAQHGPGAPKALLQNPISS